MRPDFWEMMNGQCFGDDPFAEETEYELEVPSFMCYQPKPQFMNYDIPVSAYCGQAVGRVKRRQHMEQKEHRKLVNGAFWTMVGFGLLVLAVNLPEWIW